MLTLPNSRPDNGNWIACVGDIDPPSCANVRVAEAVRMAIVAQQRSQRCDFEILPVRFISHTWGREGPQTMRWGDKDAVLRLWPSRLVKNRPSDSSTLRPTGGKAVAGRNSVIPKKERSIRWLRRGLSPILSALGSRPHPRQTPLRSLVLQRHLQPDGTPNRIS
jgi:hypothetical protein